MQHRQVPPRPGIRRVANVGIGASIQTPPVGDLPVICRRGRISTHPFRTDRASFGFARAHALAVRRSARLDDLRLAASGSSAVLLHVKLVRGVFAPRPRASAACFRDACLHALCARAGNAWRPTDGLDRRICCEIESSKLAQTKGNAANKTFASQMVTDHTKTTTELMGLLSGGKVKSEIPAAMDSSHQSKLDKLKGLSGADFDKQYASDQVSAHKDAVNLFDRYAKGGDNADLKAWAGKTEPALKHHLAMAQKLPK
jgi:predicted outer membrane protein